MDADSHDIRQRHALYAQAEQHWEEAQETVKRGWIRRKITDTKQWQNAMALSKQIRDSLGPMNRKLRSPELKPSFGLDALGDDELWAKAVMELVARRSRLTAGTSAENRDTNVGGRLLLHTPSENLACGAAEASSNGFFDVNNAPPWDIWVDFSEGTLVSWVPPGLLDVAQMGIYVNPEACIRWATWTTVAISHRLLHLPRTCRGAGSSARGARASKKSRRFETDGSSFRRRSRLSSRARGEQIPRSRNQYASLNNS